MEKLLEIKDKVNFNEGDFKLGQTGFYYACWKGHEAVVQFLLENSKDLGLDLNKAKKNGMTPFHAACFNKHENIVNLILQKASEFGIDIYLKNKDGNTGQDLWPEKFQTK